MMRRLFACLLLACLPLGALAEAAWPEVPLPEQASLIDMGGQMTVNGTPLRMQGFVAPLTLQQAADWFRRRLKRPLMENTVNRKLVLGRAEGEFFVSVQLETVGKGTRGLVAVSHLKAGYALQQARQEEEARLLRRLPAGSRVVSQMNSSEGGRHARYLVLSNPHGVQLNRERLIGIMREDGLALQREAEPDAAARSRLPAGAGAGRMLFFEGRGREALALVARQPDGETTLVLQVLTTMERFQ